MLEKPATMNPRAQRAGPTALLFTAALLLAAGCAASGSRDPEPPAPAPSPEKDLGVREACSQVRNEEEDVVEQSRRVLQETFCGATLWFDGLFGGEPDVASARQTSGRVELSTLYREFDGVDLDGRLRLRYELPTLERRVNLFLGRSDPDEMVEDREEGFALRQATPGRERPRGWLAGLGFDLTRWWGSGPEFRVGVEASTSPELFAQARFRQEVRRGARSVWHTRETFFWKSQEGIGITASADYDRALTPVLLARWGAIGTLSEASEGVVWRSATVLYRNLGLGRAVAGELFARGATSAEVPIGDYGARAIHRRPLGRPYLFGELVLGYSWPKTDPLQSRSGSAMVGVGVELLFGTFPPY
jgi:hypothetical protein